MQKQYVLIEQETNARYTFNSRKQVTDFILKFELNNFTVNTEYIGISI